MIEVDVHTGGRVVDEARLAGAAEAALRARGVERAELSVALLGDDAIRRMNARHLDHDRVTDVLSFALWQAGDPVVVGDIYIGAEQAARQAGEAGVEVGEELVRLVVHGALHVAGMDHPEGAEERAASQMYRLQERIVAQLCAAAAPDARPGVDG